MARTQVKTKPAAKDPKATAKKPEAGKEPKKDAPKKVETAGKKTPVKPENPMGKVLKQPAKGVVKPPRSRGDDDEDFDGDDEDDDFARSRRPQGREAGREGGRRQGRAARRDRSRR